MQQTFKSFLVLAFVLFFGGIFTAGIGLGLFEGVPAGLLVVGGVLLAVLSPAAALVGAAIDENAASRSVEQ